MALRDEELAGFAARLHDMARDLLSQAERAAPAPAAAGTGRPPEAVAEMLLRQRQARKGFLPPSLFHEPAWELLLSLFVAYRRGTPLNVKHLVSLVDAPVTTSQRWIDQLVHMRLVQRVVDAADRRRLEISLSSDAAHAIARYLETIE